MVECHECHREMTTAASCTLEVLHQRGRPIPLTPFRSSLAGGATRCGDCGVADGGNHHPGCDLQRCPVCNGQLLSCSCRFDELDDNEFDDEYEDDLGSDW